MLGSGSSLYGYSGEYSQVFKDGSVIGFDNLLWVCQKLAICQEWLQNLSLPMFEIRYCTTCRSSCGTTNLILLGNKEPLSPVNSERNLLTNSYWGGSNKKPKLRGTTSRSPRINETRFEGIPKQLSGEKKLIQKITNYP